MTLFKTLGLLEISLIGIFIILYLLFAWRIVVINRELGQDNKRLIIKLILRGIYFTLMIIALLGPTFGERKKEVKSVGKDIFLAIDLSKSMNAEDVEPSRLKKIKFELKKIVNEFSADRIGLIIFTSEAFLQCPLTFDHTALITLFIDPLSTDLISNKGTDFAPPLRMALDKHLNDDEENKARKNTSKIIVLVSDGEDFGEETIDIATEIEQNGIRLFTLGIGTKKGGKIPDGYKFKRDRQGNEVVSTLNAKALQELASITGGKYFEVSDKQNDVNRLIHSISNIQGEFRDSRVIDASANKYYYFLIFALVLMVLDVLITVKIVKI